MNSIRAIIVDDETLSRDLIRAFLKDQEYIETIAECSNGLETLQCIIDTRPDLVFLDIQMPDLNGFQVIKELPADIKPLFIFVTAYDKYALQAFEVSAIDYLLKPFTEERFNSAIKKAVAQIFNSKQSEFNKAVEKLLLIYSDLKFKDLRKEYLNRLLVRENKKIFLVSVKDVYCLEASGDYIRLHLRTKSHLINDSLNNLETRLDPDQFVRIHRSAIINKEKIKEFIPHFNGEYVIVLENNMQVKLSRTYKHLFKELIGNTKF
jgi:two-component system LytT family response regulator